MLHSSVFRPPLRAVPTPIALVAFALVHGSALAQATSDDPPLILKPSLRLQEQLPKPQRDNAPTFLRAERVVARPEQEALAQGKAELRQGDVVIKADRIEYDQSTDLAKAEGQVLLNRAGNVYQGAALQLKLDTYQGFVEQPRYRLLKNGAYGQAQRTEFIDEKRSRIFGGDYTTCQREPQADWRPAWILTSEQLDIDVEEDTGHASGAVLRFMGVPVLPVPGVSFPLSSERKSGFLPPTVGLDNINGVEVTVPYYWNIAPNYDATFYPTAMLRRGVDLGSEFRYLGQSYRGQARLNLMPEDRLRERSRWGFAGEASGSLNSGSALGPISASANVNRVSDDNYWRDFPRGIGSLTQRLLAADGKLSWSQGGFSADARALQWQTLQDPSAPITPPYDRLPQLHARYQRSSLALGLEASVDADTTRFHADDRLTGQPNAQRSFVLAQLSRPWQGPGGFLIPKVQMHTTYYQFDRSLASGQQSAQRNVPTLSLDSGLIFERESQWFGASLRQTLEPRVFYVYTPFRRQNHLPNYDAGANDFNFATIFVENPFSGHDRIADAHLLTLGVTSRFLDASNGAEVARIGLAQRLRFSDQQVTLPGGAVVQDRLSDLLLNAGLDWNQAWNFDTTVQYNPKLQRSVRSTIGARYHPSDFRTVSASYRLQRDLSEQLDVGWQWALGRGALASVQNPGTWYTVGRLNYSMKDRALVDSVVGLEYDGGCWIARVVLERLQTGRSDANKRLLFQLEFTGFSHVGTNALKTLKDNIPRYQYLREKVQTPSRFGHYD